MGADTEHSIAIYDWANNKIKSSAKVGATHTLSPCPVSPSSLLPSAPQGDKAKILDVTFCPGSNADFVTVGVKHVKFWTSQGQNLSGKKGILGKKGKLQAFPCCAFVNKTFVCGTAGGEVYMFDDSRNLAKVIEGHKASVANFFVTKDLLVSAGRDGSVVFFDKSISKSRAFDLKATLGALSVKAGLRSVCVVGDGDEMKMVVGTEGSEIFEVSKALGWGATDFGRSPNTRHYAVRAHNDHHRPAAQRAARGRALQG